MKKLITLAIAAALAVTMFAGCGNKAEDKTLTMATNATFPPYEFYEGEKIVGIDAEIAEKIAENALAFIDTIKHLKPAVSKGEYIKSVYLSSTMSQGIKIDTKSL